MQLGLDTTVAPWCGDVVVDPAELEMAPVGLIGGDPEVALERDVKASTPGPVILTDQIAWNEPGRLVRLHPNGRVKSPLPNRGAWEAGTSSQAPGPMNEGTRTGPGEVHVSADHRCASVHRFVGTAGQGPMRHRDGRGRSVLEPQRRCGWATRSATIRIPEAWGVR